MPLKQKPKRIQMKSLKSRKLPKNKNQKKSNKLWQNGIESIQTRLYGSEMKIKYTNKITLIFIKVFQDSQIHLLTGSTLILMGKLFLLPYYTSQIDHPMISMANTTPEKMIWSSMLEEYWLLKNIMT